MARTSVKKLKNALPKKASRAKRKVDDVSITKEDSAGDWFMTREEIERKEAIAIADAKKNLMAMGIFEWEPGGGNLDRLHEALIRVWKRERRPPTIGELSVATGMNHDLVSLDLDALEDNGMAIYIKNGIWVPVVI